MLKALAVFALVLLVVVGSLMTLKYTANMGLPKLPRRPEDQAAEKKERGEEEDDDNW